MAPAAGRSATPKSTKHERIAENFDVFVRIDALDTGQREPSSQRMVRVRAGTAPPFAGGGTSCTRRKELTMAALPSEQFVDEATIGPG